MAQASDLLQAQATTNQLCPQLLHKYFCLLNAICQATTGKWTSLPCADLLILETRRSTPTGTALEARKQAFLEFHTMYHHILKISWGQSLPL